MSNQAITISQRREDGLVHVTGLIKQFAPKFDPDGVIRRTKAKEMNITEEELQMQWNDNGRRARERGNAFNHYVKMYVEKEKYIGSNLPEFAVFQEFLKEYEVSDLEKELANDVTFGRPDCILQSRDPDTGKPVGDKIICELKTGELGGMSYENFPAPFDAFPTSKLDIARLQAALYVQLSEEITSGFVVHIGQDLYTMHKLKDEDYLLADAMMEYQRELKKKEAQKAA